MAKVSILFIVLIVTISAKPAPNQSSHEDLRTILNKFQPNDSASDRGVETPRTFVTMTILRWTMNIFKAMVKPARDMYITLTPEISAVRCLSESREVQSMFGYNLESEDDNFEGYHYESPRSSSGVDLDEDRVVRRMPRFIDEIASLLKDGGTMSCVVPYMRERVVRWLDG